MTSLPPLAFGIACGLAAALLALSPLGGGAVGGWLLAIAPMPVALAGLMRGPGAVQAALAVALLLVATVAGPLPALGFIGGLGIPAALAARAALLNRESPDGSEWYPVGRLVAWLAVACGTLGALVILLASGGEIEVWRTLVSGAAKDFLPAGEAANLPEGTAAKLPILMADIILPAALPATFLTMQLASLWAAARIAQASGGFARPLPTASDIVYPGWLLPAFGLTLVGTALPDIGSLLAIAFAGALGLAYLLYGLVLAHSLVSGRPGRFVMLAGLYGALLITPFAAPALILAGLAEHVFSLRARFFTTSS